jgi:hypothetical protein
VSDGWHRVYGRENYNGWRLYVRGTEARMYVGASFARCLRVMIGFKLTKLVGGLTVLDPAGRVLEMRMVSPKQWPKEQR